MLTRIIKALSEMPFASEAELADFLGVSRSVVHRALKVLRKAGFAGRVWHGTPQVAPCYRHYMTRRGIEEASRMIGLKSAAEYVRAYPMSSQWLRILIQRMDAVVAVYRVAAMMSPGIDGLRARVSFYRRGSCDALITLHDGRSFGIVRQGVALKRARLNDRLRAIHQGRRPRPGTVLILTPSPWERDVTADYWRSKALMGAFVAAETADTLTDADRPAWRPISSLTWDLESAKQVSAQGSAGDDMLASSPARTRASIPDPDAGVSAAPTFRLTEDEKKAFAIITDHAMISRQELRQWMGSLESRISQILRSLVDTWGLVERHGKRGCYRYTLSDEGAKYIAYRDRTQLSSTRGRWSTVPLAVPQGKRKFYAGHLVDTWARQPEHTEDTHWFLSRLAAETRHDSASTLVWTVPEWRSERAFHWNQWSITPDAVGMMIAGGARVPFFLERERHAKYRGGIRKKLGPYERYYDSPFTQGDLPPFPVALFVVDSEKIEERYLTTAAEDKLSLPILVSCMPELVQNGILGRAWRPLWEPPSTPRMSLSELAGYAWRRIDKRMARR